MEVGVVVRATPFHAVLVEHESSGALARIPRLHVIEVDGRGVLERVVGVRDGSPECLASSGASQLISSDHEAILCRTRVDSLRKSEAHVDFGRVRVSDLEPFLEDDGRLVEQILHLVDVDLVNPVARHDVPARIVGALLFDHLVGEARLDREPESRGGLRKREGEHGEVVVCG